MRADPSPRSSSAPTEGGSPTGRSGRLERAIAVTVLRADLFDYPLIEEELFRRLIEAKPERSAFEHAVERMVGTQLRRRGASLTWRDRTIPLGLDADRLPAPDPKSTRPLDVLGVGSLNDVKHYSRFVEVIDRLGARDRNLEAEIIGGGPNRAKLDRLIREKGLDDRIRFTGALPREEVLRRMGRARIFLHTARYDAQPYVLLEALASGMHVVSTPVGYTGPTDHVHFSTSTDGLAAHLRTLLREDLSHEAISVPTAAETVMQYLELYDLAPTEPDAAAAPSGESPVGS